MKYTIILICFLSFFLSINAMRVAPAPIETLEQKGARFKKECADHARVELAKKQECKERLSLRNADLSEEEIDQLAQSEINLALCDRIKISLRDIFPNAPLLSTPVALREWLKNQAEQFLGQAQEEIANRAQEKCGFFSCFTACCR